jgi:mRNA-degrading endonuclease RelE of RelBE toxin-antitoxin system
MRLARSPHFLRSYHKAPKEIQRTFEKQAVFLAGNLHHPSLHAKKYDESRRLWQARINDDWRFYFSIEGDAYILHEMRRHPKS